MFAAEDPTLHIFRFHHEDAKPRYEDVIDLRSPIRRWQSYVMEWVVGFGRKPQSRSKF
jgi:hypothetical protein